MTFASIFSNSSPANLVVSLERFRVVSLSVFSTEDATIMAREMFPEFDVEDFTNLPNYHIYLKLMIDGRPSRGFSGRISPNVIL